MVMSGPKYSYTRVDRERLRQLAMELERQLEEAKHKEIEQKILAIKEQIESIEKRIDISKYEEYIEKSENIIPNSTSLKELKKQLSTLRTVLATEYEIKGNSDFLITIQGQYEKKNLKLKNIQTLIMSTISILQKEYEKAMMQKREDDFLNTDWNIEKETYSLISPTILKEYNKILNEFIEEKNFDEIKENIDSIIKNHMVDDEYKVGLLRLREQAFKVAKTSPSDFVNMLKLKNEYIVMSTKINRDIIDIPETIKDLQEAVNELKNEVEQLTISEYVNKALSSVMNKMGYNVIGSESLIQQKIEKNYYDFSNTSIINMSSSMNGALMFEVMGKRTPNTDFCDVAAVKDDMERFCPDYNKIKSGLRDYGITMEKEKLYEPDEKYARFIDVENLNKTKQRRVEQEKRKMYQNE